MSQSVSTTPTCEAERRNKQASHYARNAWAAGHFDVAELQRLLRGDGEPDTCCGEAA